LVWLVVWLLAGVIFMDKLWHILEQLSLAVVK
jgi:hypothetical protein